MATEQVRIWRPADEDRILLMAGHTTQYAMEPRGDYVFGIVAGQPMRSHRRREQRLVRPGQLVAWDPSNAHSGTSTNGQPWSSRLMIVEVAGLAALAGDQETDILANVAFPTPVLSDPELAAEFVRLHAALDMPTTRLERDERLTVWLRTLIGRFSTVRLPRHAVGLRDGGAFRLACDYLGDHPERNVGLDELAAAAGIGKFRLIRVFRERTGLPPHALHVAHRIRAARHLLEVGQTIAATATATGFADQSHLHRHFQRGLGLTPGEYQRRFIARGEASMSALSLGTPS
jgi:AraC-like DNA-binding protein